MKQKLRCRHDTPVQPLENLTGRLRQTDRKITGPRQALLEILRHHPHPMTIREIFSSLPDAGCDLATKA